MANALVGCGPRPLDRGSSRNDLAEAHARRIVQ